MTNINKKMQVFFFFELVLGVTSLGFTAASIVVACVVVIARLVVVIVRLVVVILVVVIGAFGVPGAVAFVPRTVTGGVSVLFEETNVDFAVDDFVADEVVEHESAIGGETYVRF